MSLHDALDHIPAGAKLTVDIASLSLAAATVVQALPSIAAGLSILWSLVRLSESPRVIQFGRWLGSLFVAVADNPRLLSLIQWISSTRLAGMIGDVLARILRRAPKDSSTTE